MSVFPSQLGAAAPASKSPSYIDPGSSSGQFPLILGSTTFASSECPSDLEFGAQQHMAVTDLIGGGRRIQTFGTHPDPVTWTGRIWEQNVEDRVTDLRDMFTAGSEILLTYYTEQYHCVIRALKIKWFAIDAEYTITVEISRDANGAYSSAAPVSVDSQVAALTNTAATGAAGCAAVEAITGPNAIGPTASALTKAVKQVQQAIAGPIAQLTGVNLTSTLNAVNSATGVAQAYVSATAPGASQFAQAQAVATSLNLIGKNITSGQTSQTIQAFGGSLAEIAATQFGNADLAPDLAAVNGIQGLRLPPGVLTTIAIPPFAVTAPNK